MPEYIDHAWIPQNWKIGQERIRMSFLTHSSSFFEISLKASIMSTICAESQGSSSCAYCRACSGFAHNNAVCSISSRLVGSAGMSSNTWLKISLWCAMARFPINEANNGITYGISCLRRRASTNTPHAAQTSFQSAPSSSQTR